MGIVRPVMGVFPEAYALFVPFIIASSFTVLNLFIAIIVDSMLTPHQHEATTRSTMSLKRCLPTAARRDPRSPCALERNRVYRRNWLKSGGRFARNAFGPSRASSVS